MVRCARGVEESFPLRGLYAQREWRIGNASVTPAMSLTLERLSSILRRLYALEDPASVPVGMADVATEIVRCANASYNVIHTGRPALQIARSRGIRVPAEEEHPLLRNLGQHPLIRRFSRDGEGVHRIADFLPRREFHRTALFNEYYRKSDTQAQVGFCVAWSPDAFVMLALNHVGRDAFADEDVRLLALLQPHFRRAQALVERLQRLEESVGTVTQALQGSTGIVLLGRDLRPLHLSELARRWLGAEGTPVWARVEAWVREQARRCAGGALAVEPPEPLLLSGSAGRLRVLFRPGGEKVLPVLLVEETGPEGAPALTAREAEVLHWIAEGKTNAEIALILQAAKRTVDKHAENVFRKLGVETRTAALLRALELRKAGLLQGP